jgi:small subunit ribosomal protein S11
MADTHATPPTTETDAPKAAPKKASKRIRRHIEEGRVSILASYNNTIITFTDLEGNVLSWGSSGSSGFKGTRKSTPYAASVAAQAAAEKSKVYGLEKVHVVVTGIGSGREQAMRALQSSGLQVISIHDRTPVHHNGCRRPKPRRV